MQLYFLYLFSKLKRLVQLKKLVGEEKQNEGYTMTVKKKDGRSMTKAKRGRQKIYTQKKEGYIKSLMGSHYWSEKQYRKSEEIAIVHRLAFVL